MGDAAETRGGITLRRYAEISAHLRHAAREPACDVLGRLGLAEEAWTPARDAWRSAIDDDVEGGDGALVAEFAAVFAETRRRLEAGEETAKPRAASAPPPAPAPAIPSPLPPAPAPIAEPPAAPPITPPPLASLSSVQPGGVSPWARPKMPSGPVEPDFDPLNATVSVHPARLQAPVVPFTPGSAPALPPPSPAVSRPPAKLTGTADMDLGPVLKRVLPFAGESAASPANAAQPVNTAQPANTAQPTQTAASAPITNTPPAAPPSLTLEQYASLSAEISHAPEHVALIRARYFIASDDALRALQRTWQARFAADPALEARFHALLAQYRAWLLQRKE
ncbi:MAG: hypothetical protein QM820_17495 [Minicystis sp.]